MRPTEAEVAKRMEGKRIATVTPANILGWAEAPRTLLIRFTDGTQATIEADCNEETERWLTFEVGPWRAGVVER
jgi:hypothetical protein